MGTLFIKVIEISIVASFLMLAVIIFRLPLKKAPKWFMGVLWAIVALRLLFPFQIESKVGFLPDVGSKIEAFFCDITGTDSAIEVTTHNYEPNTGDEATYVFEADDYEVTESEEIVTDYLPNEEIIVVEDSGKGLGSGLLRRDLFIRLQMIWLFGMLLILGYAVFSYISIRKKTRESISLENEKNVFICDEIDTPFILGIFKPAIYLPSGLDDETIRNVLFHEKAHIKRLDHLRKQLGFLILAVYWFNPLVWVSYALFCKDIELACDEKVIRHMSLEEKKSYANSLLLCSTHKRLVLAYPLAFGEVGVGTRVKQIFNYRKPTFWLIVLLAIACVALSSGFFQKSTEVKNVTEDEADEDVIVVTESDSVQVTGGTQTKDSFVRQWAEDFEDRNAQGIIEASTDEVRKTLMEEGLLAGEGDDATFGWSSPWPVINSDSDSDTSCAFGYLNEERTEAEIFYCAIDSEPHVYLWKEYITIAKDENGDYKVVSEEFIRYEDIETIDDYDNAWNADSMLLNPLDYSQNGLGEMLNNNAKSSTGDGYKKLFDPLTAARYLLNLSEDEDKVTLLTIESPELGSFVAVHFSDADYDVSIDMVQPWGEDGIYVPVKYILPKEVKSEEYKIGDNGFGSLPNARGDEGEWIDLNPASEP